jgi:tetratricopeptide (TPR) repeat protein
MIAVVIAALGLSGASKVDGQKVKTPARPRAAAIADTNDARAYLNYGVGAFEGDPDDAANAFYWAARLDPTLGDAFYGYRSAEIMRMPNLRREYFTSGDNATPSKDMRRLDSLYLRAIVSSPFLYRRLDRLMFTKWWRESLERSLRQNGANMNDITAGDISHYIEQSLILADVGTRAWSAYSEGRFDDALRMYVEAAKGTKNKAGYRTARGRIFGMRNEADSAIAEFRLAIDELKKRDEKKVVVLYDSKAVLEHSIAVLLEGRGDNKGAREAYGRALQEDLSYWPAHLRLGLLALTEKDTTAALAELDLAAQVAPQEPWVRHMYGVTLSYAGRNADALEQLRKAAELEPYWAQPHATIGRLLEKENPSAAIEAYQRFLARATRNAPLRREIENRLAGLK